MNRRIASLSTVFAAAFIFSALAVPIGATTLERMSLKKMAHAARAIARARCTGTSSLWQAGEIWTMASFDSEENWKGSTPAHFQVRLLGGTVGNLTSTVSGVPHFRAGEDVILFLEPASLGDFAIVGWVEGTFRIHRAPRGTEPAQELVTQDTASFATFDPKTRRFESAGVRSLPVELFRTQLLTAILDGSGDTK